MSADVKYLGDGSAVLVLGDGPDRETSTDGGRTMENIATVAYVRLPEIEYGEAEGVFAERPEYDEQTATWAPPGTAAADAPEPAGISQGGDSTRNTDPQAATTYTEAGDGVTFIRDSDGQRGTFGPEGFRAEAGQETASWGTGTGTGQPPGTPPPTVGGTPPAPPAR